MDRAERRRQERRARKRSDASKSGVNASQTRTQPITAQDALDLARRYWREGRLADAYALYRRVLGSYPNHAPILHQCGALALQLGRNEDAIRQLRRAVASKHDFADAHNSLGIALGAEGRLDEAVQACEQAIRFRPNFVEAHVNVGNLLKRSGELDRAMLAYERAIEIDPGHENAHFQLGQTCHALDRLDRAARSLERVVELRPERADAHYSLGMVWHAMRRLDDALAAYDRAISLQPELLARLFDVGKPRHIHALFERGDHHLALDRLEEVLARLPGQSCALALKAIALDEIGEREKARSLVDFDRLIRPIRLNPPSEFGSIAELNLALADHVLRHPTLDDAPEAFSVHRGKATGELLADGIGPIRVFERMVREAVDGYRASLPQVTDHPFVVHQPRRWGLTMWGNIIESEGFQVPHIHPSGWLSGNYYVSLPDVIGTPEVGQSGWIEFGEPYQDIAHDVQPRLQAFRPEEGMLILFPSYFYHRTLPFESDQQRISIAFDVVPAR